MIVMTMKAAPTMCTLLTLPSATAQSMPYLITRGIRALTAA